MKTKNVLTLAVLLGCIVMFGLYYIDIPQEGFAESSSDTSPERITMQTGKFYGLVFGKIKEVNWDNGDVYSYSGVFWTGGTTQNILSFKASYNRGGSNIEYSLEGNYIYLFDMKYRIVRTTYDFVIFEKA